MIGGLWIPRPIREPDFGPTKFDVQASSWVDDLQRHFLPVIEADPRITIYVEVGTERDNWGIMHAWLVSRSVAALYAAVNKRVGAVAADIFLALNDWQLKADEDAYADLVLSVAASKSGKPLVAEFIRQNASQL